MGTWCLGCGDWIDGARLEPDASVHPRCPNDDGRSIVHVLVERKRPKRRADSSAWPEVKSARPRAMPIHARERAGRSQAPSHRHAGSPWECEDCVATARRWSRIGRACAALLVLGSIYGLAAALVVSNPSLTTHQWLAIVLALQLVLMGVWYSALVTARRLEIHGLIVGLLIPFVVVVQIIQLVYYVVDIPGQSVAAYSSTWWLLVAGGLAGSAVAVLVGEVFFARLWRLESAGAGSSVTGAAMPESATPQ
jgi:hypothetical protein